MTQSVAELHVAMREKLWEKLKYRKTLIFHDRSKIKSCKAEPLKGRNDGIPPASQSLLIPESGLLRAACAYPHS
jgi:hypothetical protein